MVKIALAGGAGNVGQEILDVLVATKKHEILIFTRGEVPTTNTSNGITWVQTTYSDVDDLASHLHGVSVVLSFVAPHTEQADAVSCQKNLVDACIKAVVRRFAPSEWISATEDHMDWYEYKGVTRRYLHDINKDRKVLEYCLFQPGLFANYFTGPYELARHLAPLETPFDFERRRAIVLEGREDGHVALTTVQDLAHVVARAVEFEGEWPVIGGMRGTRMSIKDLIALGDEIRGGPFTIDRIPFDDMTNGNWNSSWLPIVRHPSILPEHVDAASKTMVAGILLAMKDGGFDTTDEWNKLLPDYTFTDAKAFLRQVWDGKPR